MRKTKLESNKYVLFLSFANRFQDNLSSDLKLELKASINDKQNNKYIELYEDDVGNVIVLNYKVKEINVRFNNSDMIIKNVIIDNYADVYYDRRGVWERLDITPLIEPYLQDIFAFSRKILPFYKRKIQYIV
ncbi:MAG: hypothetical protein ACTSWZ_02095 [Candidatus Heimdallarchaeaceae archaeon]